MKTETRFITYDGVAFVYKEDAEYHEIYYRLCKRRQRLVYLVSTYMGQVAIKRGLIRSTEKMLVEINKKLRTPEVYETIDHVKLLDDRMNLRAELRMAVLNLKSIKSELVKYNRLLSKTEESIKRCRMEHERIVAGRQNKTK